MTGSRGQLSLTAAEALVGAVLVLAVTAGFALDVGGADRDPRLESHAGDAATLLRADPAAGAPRTEASEAVPSRADALAASPESFARVRDPTRRRLRAALPETVLFRIETTHGVLGTPPPDRAPTATARVPTSYGTVQIRVWYA